MIKSVIIINFQVNHVGHDIGTRYNLINYLVQRLGDIINFADGSPVVFNIHKYFSYDIYCSVSQIIIDNIFYFYVIRQIIFYVHTVITQLLNSVYI
ncbi:hypothetical protein SDC9_211937 [bioreactor metagenome]|uniref:Uncharacterized protein n=1 Tax=bioreactor metagenome TaxID=1076179 RepID=A0A645JL82_9ZZZZ